jgi:hypothetical protein
LGGVTGGLVGVVVVELDGFGAGVDEHAVSAAAKQTAPTLMRAARIDIGGSRSFAFTRQMRN